MPPGQAPNAFMELTEFELPESKLKGSISNCKQLFVPEYDPEARALQPDFPVTYAIFKKYNFDVHTSLRYALDLLSSGKIKETTVKGAVEGR